MRKAKGGRSTPPEPPPLDLAPLGPPSEPPPPEGLKKMPSTDGEQREEKKRKKRQSTSGLAGAVLGGFEGQFSVEGPESSEQSSKMMDGDYRTA